MRKRATAIVIKNGNTLLVRERGKNEYSLPGGGISRSKDFLPSEDYCEECHDLVRMYGMPDVCLKHQHSKGRSSSMLAAIRELKEETRLHADWASFLFHHNTHSHRHSVYIIKLFSGQVHVDGKEIDKFIWWDGHSPLNISRSTSDILRRFARKGK